MTARKSNQRGRRLVHVEVDRADELQAGVPGPARPVPPRDDAGRLLPGPETSAFARSGAKALHESRQYARLLGLWEPEEAHAYHPYWRLACEWRDAHMAQLAATVGGGSVGPGPASVVATAAVELGAARYLADLGAQTGQPKLLTDAARLADSSRQNLLAAHELAAREAKARPKESTRDRLTRHILGEGKGNA